MSELWTISVFAVAAFCFVRGVVDLRQRRFGWGAAGILCGIIIMTTPIPVHAIKYDLPLTGNSQG